MKEQLLLLDLGPLPPKPNKQKWTKLYKKYCEKVYDERGGLTGDFKASILIPPPYIDLLKKELL